MKRASLSCAKCGATVGVWPVAGSRGHEVFVTYLCEECRADGREEFLRELDAKENE